MSTSASSSKRVLSPITDFPAYLSHVTTTLDRVTTHAADLPGKSDLAFHRTLDRKLAKDIDDASVRVLGLAERILRLVHEPHTGGQGKLRRRMEDEDDVQDGYRRGVVEVVDSLLEDADSCLDELNGQKKKAAIAVQPNLAVAAGTKMPGPFSALRDQSTRSSLSTASHTMAKPQILFSDHVDNSLSRSPFKPNLPTKHHAMVPLDFVPPLDYTPDSDSMSASLQMEKEIRLRQHPYFYETRHLPYPTAMFTTSPPIKPSPLDETSAIWVDTPAALEEMVEQLRTSKEIAVDLEHHDTHSYYGFTCLMQISTREHDWIVDTLALRQELRDDKLGGVMADPAVLKVFHGADSDICWLQKDFDIYISNLFDTYHATRVLELPQRSLAHLLQRYCGFQANKKYQMADWRTRPLTPEMLRYAQADTHFLLSIYDHLRNALLEKSRPSTPEPSAVGGDSLVAENGDRPNPQRAMRQVLEWSAETALRLYERDTYNADTGKGSRGWYNAGKRHLPERAWDEQVGLMWKQLHAWRDLVARELDESPQYILPPYMLKSLSFRPPFSIQAVRNVVHPRAPIASERAEDILKVVKKAAAEWSKVERKQARVSPTTSPRRLPITLSESSPRPSTKSHTKQTIEPIEGLSDAPDHISSSKPQTSASTSSLFGSTLMSHLRVANDKSRGLSALFGDTLSKTTPPGAPTSSGRSFNDVIARVMATFAPEPPKTVSEPSNASSNSPANELPEPETVPFVPAKARTMGQGGTTPESSLPVAPAAHREFSPARERVREDMIVKVGRKKSRVGVKDVERERPTARAKSPSPSIHPCLGIGSSLDTGSSLDAGSSIKKRKKDKEAEKEKKDKKTKVAMEDIPVYDYATAPNLLDNPESGEIRRTKKGKKAKKPRAGLSDTTFGKTPKDQSQPRGGNKSATFNG